MQIFEIKKKSIKISSFVFSNIQNQNVIFFNFISITLFLLDKVIQLFIV